MISLILSVCIIRMNTKLKLHMYVAEKMASVKS